MNRVRIRMTEMFFLTDTEIIEEFIAYRLLFLPTQIEFIPCDMKAEKKKKMFNFYSDWLH